MKPLLPRGRIEGKSIAVLHQPHDKLFKLALGDRPTAISLFRAFLPGKFTRHLDWRTAALQPGSYVDREFKASQSDILYHVKSRDSAALLYILFEHQTTEDPWLALRLLGYKVRIWNDYRKAQPAAGKLPVVIPLVLAHTQRAWSSSTRFASLFPACQSGPSDYAECIPDFVFQVIQLATLPFNQIVGTPLGVAVLRVMKAARMNALLSDEVWDIAVLENLTLDEYEVIVRYILSTDLDREAIKSRVAKLSSERLRIKAMSVADQLRQEGKQEGEIIGRKEGEKVGVLAGSIQTLQRVLGKPVTPVDVLLKRSVDQLRRQHALLQRQLR